MRFNKINKKNLILFNLKILPYLAIVGIWIFFVILNPIQFWQQIGDYHWYALSHALTMESKIYGFPATNHGYNIHPALIFGVANWLAFRITTLGIFDFQDRVSYLLNHAEIFYFWGSVIALGLNLIALLIIQKFYKEKILHAYIALLFYFSSVPVVFESALLYLTNESFSLLYIFSAYFLVFKFFNQKETKSFLFFKQKNKELSISFILGVMSSIGISQKIYYLSPAFGFLCALISAFIFRIFSFKHLVTILISFVLGFLLFETIVILIIGKTAFLNWINWNYAMLSHSDRYGSGNTEFILISNVINAIKDLYYSSYGTFPLIFSLVAMISAFVLIKAYKNAKWRIENLFFFIAIFFGASINLLGLLKHYSPHYAIPLCSVFPFLIIFLKDIKYEKIILIILFSVSITLLVINIYQSNLINNARLQTASLIGKDINAIYKLPINQGEKRVWAYFSPTKEGVLPLVVGYIGSEHLNNVIFDKFLIKDISPNNDRDVHNWRYVIFPKSYYPTIKSIPEIFPNQFDFDNSKFSIRQTDKFLELEYFIVLCR
jgi:hypothetical protein